MLFYGNLLVLLITENRSHILKTKRALASGEHIRQDSRFSTQMPPLNAVCVPSRAGQSPGSTHRDKAARVLPLLGHKAVHVCSQLILGEQDSTVTHLRPHTLMHCVCFARRKFEVRSCNAPALIQVLFKLQSSLQNDFRILTLVYAAKQFAPFSQGHTAIHSSYL